MKYIYTLLILILTQSSVYADDEYTDNIYSSVTILYWCLYKDIPKNKSDISKVTDIDEPNKNITMDFDEWLKTLNYKIEDDVMIIKSGNITSKSKCETVEIIKK